MKNIGKIILLFSLSLPLTSCNNFLTLKPETDLAPETFFASEKELELWSNRFYNIFDGPNSEAIQLSDIQISKSMSAVQQGTRSPATESWENSWKDLRYINYMLERSNNCPDEAARLRFDGVGYFFRALFYLDKVQRYGDIAYYNHVISDIDEGALKRPRDSRGFVMKRVMEELDLAIKQLPTAWPTDPLYHVSINAALALKARAALFEGTFRKYHHIADQTIDGVTISADYFLNQAADAAEKLIATGNYSLYNKEDLKLGGPYRELFILEDAFGKETILSMRFNADILVRHNIQFTFRNMRHSATRRFTDHYLMADGSTIQEQPNYATMSYNEQFKNRDPRMAQTLMAPGYIDYKGIDEVIADCKSYDMTGYRIIKFVSDASHDGASTSTTDWSIFRYPEVLLIYAEAKAELGTLTQDDIDQTINLIRNRVKMKKLSMADANAAPDALLAKYYPNVTKGANQGVILEIRRERTIELYAEGLRQWDLFRWREGAQLVPSSNVEGGYLGCYFPALGEYDMNGDNKSDLILWSGTKPGVKPGVSSLEVGSGKDIELTEGTKGYITCFSAQRYKWDEVRDYLWPIPADQRVITGGALTQNPGYDDGLSF